MKRNREGGRIGSQSSQKLSTAVIAVYRWKQHCGIVLSTLRRGKAQCEGVMKLERQGQIKSEI